MGQRAAFWNFAREDYLAAYINRTRTRMDTEDITIWQAAGLHLRDSNYTELTDFSTNMYADSSAPVQLDVISNTLVWLLSRIMNFLALEVDNVEHANEKHSGQIEPDQSMRQQTIKLQNLAALWSTLWRDLNTWSANLPPTFRPCAILQPQPQQQQQEQQDQTPYPPTIPRKPFPEIYYNVPMRAATMQHFHFASILLLLHQPRDMNTSSNSMVTRLHDYRHISEQVDRHIREICGIALSRPPAAVRIHMLQPLYLAGLIVERQEERQLVVELLRDIETDLGWATQYRVDALRTEWGWENGYPASHA